MNRRDFLTATFVGSSLVGCTLAAGAFFHETEISKVRLTGRSSLVRTRVGAMEYSVQGIGKPILILHGTGGGFDQGLEFAQPLLERGFQLIAPSRFGYLRSAMPVDASPASQADAVVDLLDALEIKTIPVLGGSAGALSAIAFAIRHPDRCHALIALVPAAYAPGRDVPKPPSQLASVIIDYSLSSDFLFWSGTVLGEDAMISALLATDPALVHAASPVERARIRRILHHILPVSARKAGFLNDAKLASRPEAMNLQAIKCPTFSLSLSDDRFQTEPAARYIADQVKGSTLVILPQGGHVWVGHNGEVFDHVARFLSHI